jgi:hypothetical protein
MGIMPAVSAGPVVQMHQLWFSSAKAAHDKLFICRHLVMATEMHLKLI